MKTAKPHISQTPMVNLKSRIQTERELQHNPEQTKLLLKISAWEDMFLEVLTIHLGEKKAQEWYDVVKQGVEWSSRRFPKIMEEIKPNI